MINKIYKTLIFLILLVIVVPVRAENRYQLVKDIFEDHNFEVCLPEENECDGSFSVLFSSDMQKDEELPKFSQNTLIICDETLENSSVLCTPNSITPKERSTFRISNERPAEVFYQYDTKNNSYLVYAPESLVVFQGNAGDLETFLNDLARPIRKVEISSQAKGNLEKVQEFIDNPVFELLYAGFFIFLFYLILKPVLALLINNRKEVNPVESFLALLRNLKQFSEKYRYFAVFVLVFTILGYAYSLVFVSILDVSKIDLLYMLEYFFSTLDYSNLVIYFEQGSELKLIYYITNMYVVFLAFSCLLPEILTILINFFKSLNNRKIKNSTFFILLLMFFIILNTYALSLKASTFAIGMLIVIIIFKNKENDYVRNKYRNLSFVLSIILITLAVLSVYNNQKKQEMVVNTIDFREETDYFTIPLNLSLSEKFEIIPKAIDLRDDIYANSILVFSPNHKFITNTDIRNFDKEKNPINYILFFKDSEDFIYQILNNNSIESMFFTENMTNVMSFNGENNKNYILTVESSCDQVIDDSIDIKFYYMNNNQPAQKHLTTIKQIECEGDDLKTYSYEFRLNNIPEDRIFIEFDMLPLGISSITLSVDGRELDFSYYQYPENGYYKNVILQNTELVNFTSELTQDLIFDNSDKEDKVIFNSINALIDQGYLEGNLVIWSPTTNIIMFAD